MQGRGDAKIAEKSALVGTFRSEFHFLLKFRTIFGTILDPVGNQSAKLGPYLLAVVISPRPWRASIRGTINEIDKMEKRFL